jgi:pimeloyl-ACP methyl ester carboxylesterase
LSSSNFVPASISIPTIPFSGPTTANPIGTFADITIPVYIIGGDKDEINSPINLSILAILFPNGFVEELRGVPHFSPLTNYEVLANKFINFINQVDEQCSFLYS